MSAEMTMTPSELLESLYDTPIRGDTLFKLYDIVDQWHTAGDFHNSDELLRSADLTRLNDAFILGLLTTTLPAKGHLTERDNLYNRSVPVFESRGHNQQRINEYLMGLK